MGCTFFDLPFLADIPVEALPSIICNPCQVQLQPHPELREPIPAQPECPYTPPRIPVHFLLALQVNQQVLTQPRWLLAFLARYLTHTDGEKKCV